MPLVMAILLAASCWAGDADTWRQVYESERRCPGGCLGITTNGRPTTDEGWLDILRGANADATRILQRRFSIPQSAIDRHLASLPGLPTPVRESSPVRTGGEAHPEPAAAALPSPRFKTARRTIDKLNATAPAIFGPDKRDAALMPAAPLRAAAPKQVQAESRNPQIEAAATPPGPATLRVREPPPPSPAAAAAPGLAKAKEVIRPPAPLSAPPTAAVDLSNQFLDAETRDQCDVGACHAFGSVALLEAAVYREKHSHQRLSEADLLIKRTLTTEVAYKDVCSGSTDLAEGCMPSDDLKFALQNGLATEKHDYSAFLDRYRKYREDEKARLSTLKSTYNKTPWPWKMFLKDPRQSWIDKQLEPSQRELNANILSGGREKELQAEREKMRALFQGFKLEQKEFPEDLTLEELARCRDKGQPQIDFIAGELHAGRPVLVSMMVSGMPAWGNGDVPVQEKSAHAFVIIGMKEGPEGLVFMTRNSWGGDNPRVYARQACRIFQALSLRTPSDVHPH